MKSLRAGLLLTLLLTVVMAAPAAERAPGTAAIASAHPLATEAGNEVLRAGGNAFDAAVAVSAALMVVEPSGSGFLGGGMFLLHRASDGRNVVIDAREVAPRQGLARHVPRCRRQPGARQLPPTPRSRPAFPASPPGSR